MPAVSADSCFMTFLTSCPHFLRRLNALNFSYCLSHVCISPIIAISCLCSCSTQTTQSIAPPLSRDLWERVVHWRLEDGKIYRELEKLAGCSHGTICNILHYYHEFGQLTNPFNRQLGPVPLLNAEDMYFINNLLERELCLFLDELQDQLENDQG